MEVVRTMTMAATRTAKVRPAAGPSESVDQQRLFTYWVPMVLRKYPELALLHHIPNGGSRSKAEAGRFKAEGVKAGVPDICLPVARGGFHGCYIELKRETGGRVAPEQVYWLEQLAEQDYYTEVCKGWVAAARALINYLNLGSEEELTEKMEIRTARGLETIYY